MGRLGKLPVEILEKVKVDLADDKLIITGPKGSLTRDLTRNVKVTVTDSEVSVEAKGESKHAKAMQGTTRSHIKNMMIGVTDGWKKELEVNGPGYRAEVKGDELVLTVGFSHPVIIKAKEHMSFNVTKNVITVESLDKEDVGFVSALIRETRKPNVYTGSGIKYKDEVIRRKAGKQAGAE